MVGDDVVVDDDGGEARKMKGGSDWSGTRPGQAGETGETGPAVAGVQWSNMSDDAG